jgi:ABC-2 type transport system ATP-binding protein
MAKGVMDSATKTAVGASRAHVGGREQIVVVEHLTKVFRDFWMRARVKAVDDVSFDVHRGEIFGLLGPNGSGKSTTIKIMLGLLHKTRGRCALFGKVPTDVAVKKRIGYLPEESYLYQFLNARETLDYYAKLFGLDHSVRTRRIDELLDMVGLTAVQFRPVREYSKGMQRRIGIAQALINDPELLILDEPTTGLDPIGTRQIKDLILELGRRGKTVILSSHLLGDVEDCVDRMVILYGGKVQAAGTCDELLESQDRTTIETEALDEETISAIDALIRQRSGGSRQVDRVSHPRQKLEDLFVGIVEQARAKKLETAGAQHGGQTAAFLRGEAAGADVISKLMRTEESAGRAAKPTPTAPAAPSGPDSGVIGDLLKKNTEPAVRPATPAPGRPASAKPTHDVDQGVIGSLLGRKDDKDHGKDTGKPG